MLPSLSSSDTNSGSLSLVLGLAFLLFCFCLRFCSVLYLSPSLSTIVSSEFKRIEFVRFNFSINCSGADLSLRLTPCFPLTRRWIESMQDRGRDPTRQNFRPPCLLRKVFFFCRFLGLCAFWIRVSGGNAIVGTVVRLGGRRNREMRGLRFLFCVCVFCSFLGNQTEDTGFYRR